MTNLFNVVGTDEFFQFWPLYPTEVSPDKMLADIRASSVDPNDLIELSEMLAKAGQTEHAIVALKEGIRQLTVDPKRLDSKTNLLFARRNLVFLLERSRNSLGQFEVIKEEPRIVQADPKLALAVVEGLINRGHFAEAATVFEGIDQISPEVLKEKLAGIHGGYEMCQTMRAEIIERTRWNELPGWWDDIPPGDVRRIIPAVEENLQRRVGLGHADTLSLIRQLAVTGDRRAIPILKQALSHHRLDVRTDAALALHALGDPTGLENLISALEHGREEDAWKVAGALRCIRSPRSKAALAKYELAEEKARKKRREEEARRIREGLCVNCGRPLGFTDKIANRNRHKQC